MQQVDRRCHLDEGLHHTEAVQFDAHWRGDLLQERHAQIRVVYHLDSLLAGQDLLDQIALYVRCVELIQTFILVDVILETFAFIANHDVNVLALLENKRTLVVGDAHVIVDLLLRYVLLNDASLRVYYLEVQHKLSKKVVGVELYLGITNN